MPNEVTSRTRGQRRLSAELTRWLGPDARANRTVLASLSIVVVLTLFALAQYTAGSRPVLGVHVSPCTEGPLCISWVAPAGNGWDNGLRVGDPVTRVLDPVDGAGPIRAVEVPRETIPTIVSAPSVGQRGPSRWALPIVGLVYGALGALVLWRRPDLPAARAFWLSTLSVAGATVLQPASSDSAPWALPLQFVLIVLIPWALWRFLASIVPANQPLYERVDRTAIVLGLLIVGVYAVVIAFVPNLYGLPRALASLYFIALILSSLAFLGFGLFRGTPGERAIVRDMAVATFLGFAPLIFVVFVPIAVWGHGLVEPETAALALVAIPLGFVYGVFRHQILGIRRLVNRGLVYGMLSLLIFGAVILVVVSFDQSFPNAVSLERYEIWMLAGLVLISVLVFTSLRPHLQGLVDRYLYRDSYDYASALAGFTKQVKGQATAYAVVTTMLGNLSEIMKVEGFLLMRGPGDEREHRYSGGQAASRLLQASSRPDFVPGPGLAVKYMEGEPILAVPLEDNWTLWLGPKAGGETFRSADIRLVDAVASLVSVLLTRIRQNEELRDLNGRIVTAQEEERTRLSHEIHDGPLQQLSVITRLPGQTEQTVQIARDAARELRAISTALHPPVLDLFGLIPGLEWLAEQAMSQHNLDISVTSSGFDNENRLPGPIELALFRCVQEALTNITKHAQATRVAINLELRPSEVLVRVEDNGVGFDMKRRLEAAADGHLGLVGMRERLVHLSGQLQIDSAVGRGTIVSLRLPLELPSPKPIEAA